MNKQVNNIERIRYYHRGTPVPDKKVTIEESRISIQIVYYP